MKIPRARFLFGFLVALCLGAAFNVFEAGGDLAGTWNQQYVTVAGVKHFYAIRYGTCVWGGPTHDVLQCIDLAQAACVTAGGGIVDVPAGNYGGLPQYAYNNQTAGCEVEGAGGAGRFSTAITTINPISQFSGPVMYSGAPAGNAIWHAGIRMIKVACGGLAPYGIEIQQVTDSYIDAGGDASCTDTGNWITSNNILVNGQSGPGTQKNHIRLLCNAPVGSIGTCNKFDGSLGPNDVSDNDIEHAEGAYDTNEGTLAGYADGNRWMRGIAGFPRAAVACNTATTYTQGQVVKLSGTFYAATSAAGNVNQCPPNATYWTPTLSDTGSYGRGFVKATGTWWVSCTATSIPYVCPNSNGTNAASFTASIDVGGMVHVTAVTAGMPPIQALNIITDPGAVTQASNILQGTYFLPFGTNGGTGTGGVGSYQSSINYPVAVSSETMYALPAFIPASGIPCCVGMVPNNSDDYRLVPRGGLVEGFADRMTITPNPSNAGNAAPATVALSNSTNVSYSKTGTVTQITFSSVPATVVAGEKVTVTAVNSLVSSATNSGVEPNSLIDLVTSPTITLHGDGIVASVTSNSTFVFSSAPNWFSTAGNWTIVYSTDTDGGLCPNNTSGNPWCLLPPAGSTGQVESGLTTCGTTVVCFRQFTFMYSGAPTSHDIFLVALPFAQAGMTAFFNDPWNHDPPLTFGIGSSGGFGIRGQPMRYMRGDGSMVGPPNGSNFTTWVNYARVSGTQGFGRYLRGTVLAGSGVVDGIIDHVEVICAGNCNPADNLIDYYVDGVSQYSLDVGGDITTAGFLTIGGDFLLPGTLAVHWNGRGQLSSSAVGVIQLGPANSGSPADKALYGQGARGGTDTNIAGGNVTLAPGMGTGNATGNCLNIAGAHATTSGQTQQVPITDIQACDGATSVSGSLNLSGVTGGGASSQTVCVDTTGKVLLKTGAC